MATEVEFQEGPRNHSLRFQDQALSALNDCCPCWNANENPTSHMIPPIFLYKNPERPDHELEPIKRAGQFDRGVIDRGSDDAEHLIFDALNTLVNERFAAPFVALHGFNICRVGAHLTEILPELPDSITKRRYGEFDYVLIGPRIGIVVVEVKSTHFMGKRDFISTLPDQYKRGIEQLRLFDDVLDFLSSTVSIDRKSVRRILFTPNLKKTRFDEWFDGLEEKRQNYVNDLVKGIDRWFWEDAQPASRLCDKLRCYLQDSPATLCLPLSAYNLCTPILVGLLSMIRTKTTVSIDRAALSKAEAVLRVSQGVWAYNPWSLEPSNPLDPHNRKKGPPPPKKGEPTLEIINLPKWTFFTPEQPVSDDTLVASNLPPYLRALRKRRKVEQPSNQIDLFKRIFLTPQQSRALNGPPRQFIVGAAGTGKTVILQARALQVLQTGQSVLVLCSDLYIDYYVELFRQHGILNGFSVRSWQRIRDNLPHTAVSNLRLMGENNAKLDAARNFISESLRDPQKSTSLIEDYFFKTILEYDHILIDDAFIKERIIWDTRLESIYVMYPLLSMAYAEQTSPSKTVWVALDPFTDENYFLSPTPMERPSRSHHFYSVISQLASCYFDVSCLDRVLRNPENIFQSLLLPTTKVDFQAPLSGHKIQGCRFVKTLYSYDSLPKEVFDLLINVKCPLDQIALIFGECESSIKLKVMDYLRERNINCVEIVRGSLKPLDALGMYNWNEVHSMEWPLVIYIDSDTSEHPACFGGSQRTPSFRFRHYLACSRATGMLAQFDLCGPE